MTGSNSFLTTKMMLWTVLLLLVMGPSSCNAFHWQSNGHMVSQPDLVSSFSSTTPRRRFDDSPLTGPLFQASSSSSSSSNTTPSRSSTSLPKRKKKRKQQSKNKKTGNTGPLTEHDLAEHVSELYIHGPGGVLREQERRRQRRQHELQQRHKQPPQQPQDDDDPNDAALVNEQEQLASIRRLDRHPALLLNADYQPMSYLPLSLWSWQEAVKAVFSGKVTVVDVYPEVTIRAANLEVPLPAVIALTDYVPLHQQTPAFTKRNVFLRDEYRCQYCHGAFHTRELSLDHVVPRCKGGRLHWENAVTCCRKCNGRKGSLDLREIRHVGMRLVRLPRTPTQYELAATAARMVPRRVHPTWEPFLGVHHAASSSSSSQQQKQKRQQHSEAAALEEEI